MIKKTLLITILLILVSSCGKKGDPEYKVLNKEIKIPSIILNKIS